MEDKEKRIQCVNYTEYEKQIIFQLLEDYKEFIENKKTDGKNCVLILIGIWVWSRDQ